MIPTTLLTISNKEIGQSFAFARYEIPENINFGGEQRTVKHEMVGGARVIDVLGASPDDIEWSGMFVGLQAVDRAKYLDGIRKDGKKWTLIWSKFRFEVILKSFKADFHQFHRISYKIVFEVVNDLTKPVKSKPLPSLDQLITDDFGMAGILGAEINDESISEALIKANAALAVVGTIKSSGVSALTNVLLPINQAKNAIPGMIATSGALILGSGAIGSATAGVNPQTQAANINTSITELNKTSSLLSMDSLLGRVKNNLGTVGK